MTAVERAKIVAQRQIEAKYAEKLADVDRSNDQDKAKVRETLEEAKRKETEAAVAKVVRDVGRRRRIEIQQSLTDALFKGLESGKDFGRHLRDALKNMFNTLVLRPVINAIVAPVSGALAGVLGGSSGSPSGGGGGFSNYGGLIGAGLQAYGGYTAGASAASLAYANGVGLAGGDALGALIAGNGGWTGVGSAFGGIMSSIATVMPYRRGHCCSVVDCQQPGRQWHPAPGIHRAVQR